MPNEKEPRPAYQRVTLKQKGEVIEVWCKRVDLNHPQFDSRFETAPRYKKVAPVRAQQATTKTEVETTLDATKNTAQPSDWIVTNPGGEQYVLSPEEFQKRYHPLKTKKGGTNPKENRLKLSPFQKTSFSKHPGEKIK